MKIHGIEVSDEVYASVAVEAERLGMSIDDTWEAFLAHTVVRGTGAERASAVLWMECALVPFCGMEVRLVDKARIIGVARELGLTPEAAIRHMARHAKENGSGWLKVAATQLEVKMNEVN